MREVGYGYIVKALVEKLEWKLEVIKSQDDVLSMELRIPIFI